MGTLTRFPERPRAQSSTARSDREADVIYIGQPAINRPVIEDPGNANRIIERPREFPPLDASLSLGGYGVLQKPFMGPLNDDRGFDFSRGHGEKINLPTCVEQPGLAVPLRSLEDASVHHRRLLANLRSTVVELARQIELLVRETDGASKRIPALRSIRDSLKSDIAQLEALHF